MGENLETGENSVAHGLVELGIVSLAPDVVDNAVLRPCRRNVGLTIGEVVGAPVVLGMGVLPSEIGHEEGLVEDEADDVIEELGGAECPVPALVGNDPVPGQNRSHPKTVQVPTQEPS